MDIGWIGLGDIGQVIVPRLLEAGHRVRGWNRTISKAAPLVDLGMGVTDSAADAARGADFVFSVVTDSNAVRSVEIYGVVFDDRKGRARGDDPDARVAAAGESELVVVNADLGIVHGGIGRDIQPVARSARAPSLI